MSNTCSQMDERLVAGVFMLVPTARGAAGDGWTAQLMVDPGCQACGQTPAAAIGALVLRHPAAVARAFAAVEAVPSRPTVVERATGHRAGERELHGYRVVLADGSHAEAYLFATETDRTGYESSVTDDLSGYGRHDLHGAAIEVAALAAIAHDERRVARAGGPTRRTTHAASALARYYALNDYQVVTLIGLVERYATEL